MTTKTFVGYVVRGPQCTSVKGALRCQRAEGHGEDLHVSKTGGGTVMRWPSAEALETPAEPAIREVQVSAPTTDADARRFWAVVSPDVAAALLSTRPLVCLAWEIHHLTEVGISEMVRRRVDGHTMARVHPRVVLVDDPEHPDDAYFWCAGPNGEHRGYTPTLALGLARADEALAGIPAMLVGGIPTSLPDITPRRVPRR